jgi:hypothetical protein
LNKNGVFLLSRFLKLNELNGDNYEKFKANEWRTDYYETYFPALIERLVEIFKDSLKKDNDLNILDSVYVITPTIVNCCHMHVLVHKNYIEEAVSILNSYSTLDIKMYSWVCFLMLVKFVLK